MHPLTPLPLLLLTLAEPRAAEFVELSRAAFEAMQVLPAPIEPVPALTVTDRVVRLVHRDEQTHVEVRWQVEVARPEWVRWRLLGPEVDLEGASLDGQPVELEVGPDGAVLVARLTRPVELTVTGRLRASGLHGPASLSVWPAARGRVELDAPGRALELSATGGAAVQAAGAWWTGAAQLAVRLVPERARVRGPIVQLVGDVGLTVGDADVRGRARLSWRVRGSAVDEVRVRVEGVGDDLAFTGAQLAEVRREGSLVVLKLRRPVLGEVSVQAQWTLPVPAGAAARVPVPAWSLPGGAEPDVVLLITRDDAVELVPELPGAQVSSPRALAARTDGLAEGTPTSAFQRVTGGSLLVQRFQPIELPAVVVDVADWQVSLSAEGRAVLQGALTVRNERGAHLDVRLPVGARMLAVQVDGRPVTVAQVGEQWRVPLPRSVETVQGPLAFPVDLTVVQDGLGAWERREMRALSLPALGAETAVRRVTLSLPRGWEGRFEEGLGGQVSSFTEGGALAYGFGAGARESEAQARYREAVAAWMDNDFEVAQRQLDALRQIGVGNENVARLQSNLDVTVATTGEGAVADDAAARRIRSQARARAADEVARQEDVLREAEQAYAQGDYGVAERLWSEGLELTDKLGALEEEESVAQDEYRSRAIAGLQASRSVAKKDAPVRRPSLTVVEDASPVVTGEPDEGVETDVARIVDASEPEPEEWTETAQAVVVTEVIVGASEIPAAWEGQSGEEPADDEFWVRDGRGGGEKVPSPARRDVERVADDTSGGISDPLDGDAPASGAAPSVPMGRSYQQSAQPAKPTDDSGSVRDGAMLSEVLSADVLRRVPAGRSYQQAVQVDGETATDRKKNQPATPPSVSTAATGGARGPMPPPPPAAAEQDHTVSTPAAEAARAKRKPAPLDLTAGPALTATPATVVPPRFGEEVRFQHLLVPADDAAPLSLHALHRPRSPR